MEKRYSGRRRRHLRWLWLLMIPVLAAGYTLWRFGPQRSYTAQQLGLDAEQWELPLVVVSDGRLLEHNLTQLGRDRAWLDKRLEEGGCSDPRQVFLLLADRDGKVYLTRKDFST